MSEDQRNHERNHERGGHERSHEKHDEGSGGARGGHSGGRGGDSRGGRGGFRRKVCPFLADKTILLDFKNIRVIQRFVTETGKIVPRHVSGVSAKYQRKLTTHIKRARSIGLLAPLAEE